MAKLERKAVRVHKEDIRLNKFLSMAGVGSRRSNDELILSGYVQVNGKTVRELGTKVDPSRDKIFVQGMQKTLNDRKVYIVLNKPKDSITTLSDEKNRTTIMSYVNVRERVYPVGRLDRKTTGVLFLTNDGDFANALMHPKSKIEKVYRVSLDRAITQIDLSKLRRGVRLSDGMAKPDSAEIIDGSGRTKVLIVLHEGRNREVRRIFEAIGYDVKQLDRVSYAGITPLGITRGEWRHLSKQEVQYLKQLSGLSTKREEDYHEI